MEELKKAQKNLAELIHNQRKMGLTVSGLEEVQDQLKNHEKQLLLHDVVVPKGTLVCNYCLDKVSSLPDDFGCQSCIDNYK